MRAALIVLATALGVVNAASNMLTPYGALNKRQAFDPDETTGSGANCVEAFGEGYIECVPATAEKPRLCINPDLGETCCDSKWGCPGESFCLVQDLCCPDGLDPKTCAKQNGVTLPPDFSVSTTSPPAVGPSATPSFSDVLPSITSVPYGHGGSGGGSGSGSGSGNATATRSARPPFQTAGAHHERAGIAAAVLGLAAAFVL